MSYPYRVVVTKGVEESITACDRSERTVELPPILDKETTGKLFEEALKKRGWEKGEKAGTLTKTTADGLKQTVDLESGVVVTEISDEATIKKELTLEGHGDAWTRPTAADEEALRKRVEERIDKRIKITDAEREARRAKLEEELAKKLEDSEGTRTEELNEALLEVYAESLKEKARGMGDVVEIREESGEAGEYELVIRVEA